MSAVSTALNGRAERRNCGAIAARPVVRDAGSGRTTV